ncbi:MAG: phage holin family protein [Candidatus Limnocylindrales bacterium]
MLIPIGINAAALLAAVELVPGLQFDVGPDWWKLLLVAIILGLLNTCLRPIARLLALPLNVLTLGLAGVAINTAMVLVLALTSDRLQLGFTIYGWPARPFTLGVLWVAVMAALVVSAVALALSLALREKRVLGLRI